MQNWGFVIKELRERSQITQEELANRLNIKRARLSHIKLGYIKKPDPLIITNASAIFDIPIEDLNKKIYGQSVIKKNVGSDVPIAIPVYTEFRFHAPGGIEAPVDYVYIQKTKTAAKNISAFTIEGDCMEPLIHDGDYIVVDSDADINTGDTIACKCNDELHIGKLRKFDNEFWLENRTGRFKLMDCQIVAKVIQITRKL